MVKDPIFLLLVVLPLLFGLWPLSLWFCCIRRAFGFLLLLNEKTREVVFEKKGLFWSHQ
jgi:hypothetical protein